MIANGRESNKVNNFSKVQLARMIANEFLMSRAALINQQMLDPCGRNLDKECGYPDNLAAPEYYYLYERVGVANRVVGVYPSESWSVYPELYEVDEEIETEFEARWKQVCTEQQIWHYLDRIDELSGIGRYGVLLLGFDDLTEQESLSKPAPGIDRYGRMDPVRPKTELIYVRPFDESQVKIIAYERDFGNPRFGKPTMYRITYTAPGSGGDGTEVTFAVEVHWTRIIHIADNCKSSEVYGLPRMRPVIPEIMDIRKIRGGSAEMFWRGAFPGYSFETPPEFMGEEITMDEESLKEQIDEYSAGLKRYIAIAGVTAKSLAPQVADPSHHLAEQYISICATLGIPLRVFLGSESGHLASTQDAGTWNRRLGKRQTTYIEPRVINPLVWRLIAVGVLPVPQDGKFYTAWSDLNSISAKDRADIGVKKTQALMAYVTGAVEQIMSPLEFFTLVLGFTPGEAKAILKKASRKGRKMLTEGTLNKLKMPGGGRDGNANEDDPGNPGTDATGGSRK